MLKPHSSISQINIGLNNVGHKWIKETRVNFYLGAKSTWLTTYPAQPRPVNITARERRATARSRCWHEQNPVAIRHAAAPAKPTNKCVTSISHPFWRKSFKSLFDKINHLEFVILIRHRVCIVWSRSKLFVKAYVLKA